MEQSPFMDRLRELLGREELAPATVRRTLIDTDQFRIFMEEGECVPLDPHVPAVTAVDLAEWRGRLQRAGMRAGTIQRKFASLRKALLLISPELTVRLRWPKMPVESRPSPSGFTSHQRRLLMRAIEMVGRDDPRSHAILLLLVHTGARSQTIAATKLSKVKIRERSGEVEYDVSKGTPTHTGRTYTVPLVAAARDSLRRWIAVRPTVDHDHLFTSERFPYPPITRKVVWATWKSLERFLPRDFPLAGPHKARHDLARRLLSGDLSGGGDGMGGGRRQPAQWQDVARILGHAGGDPRITLGVYGSASEDDLRRTMEDLVGDGGES